MRSFLSEDAEKEEREDRHRLREIDAKIDRLRGQRLALVEKVRALSAEQKELFDARKEPQVVAERLHREHQELGRRLSALRSERDRARHHLDELVARAREIRAEVAPGDRVRPDRVRKEIQELEARQQTRALPLAEENALIDRLRERTRFLHDLEARESVLREHEQRRKEAEAAILSGRAEVERIGQEWTATRSARDQKMTEIRTELERAGRIVAQIREKALARRELMQALDRSGRAQDGLDDEAR